MDNSKAPMGQELDDGNDNLPVRLAIFKTADATKIHLATITLTENNDGTWSLQANGPSNDSIESVKPTLERFTASRQASTPNTTVARERKPPEALTEMLVADGFIVDRLPNGDHQVTFQIDLDSGTVVGTHTALHPLAASDDGLGRKVFETITAGFSKAADDLAQEIDVLLAESNAGSALAAIKRDADRGLFGLQPTGRLLDSLMRIEVSNQSGPDKRLIHDCRLHVAQRLNRFDIAGVEADAILAEDGDTLNAEQKATLRMTGALGSLTRGNKETALTVLRSLLKPPSDLTAEGRGWAWRNVSLVLSPDDPEARLAAQHSADAFLEAGKKEEAGKSLFRLANLLLREEPAKAVKALDEMVTVLDREGLRDRFVRGAALHARANRLAKLHRHTEAFRDADEAVELQRGLLGAETYFISSLHLAAIEAKYIGKDAKADALEAEADKLTAELQIPHFQLAQRVSALTAAFDPHLAANILRDAEATKNLEVFAATRIIQATNDSSLTDAQRLEILEETERRIISGHGRTSMLLPVRFAIGRQLALMGEPKRAIEWFRKVLSGDPLDLPARDALIDCLWKTEQWGLAATFLRGLLDKVGDKPGLLFAYGKSLFESGDFSRAVTTLSNSAELADHDANLRTNAITLRDRAIKLGGTILSPTPPKPTNGPVTRDEFEAAIKDFTRFISTVKRMTFWTKEIKDYQWIENPERLAQHLLHTFLQARFGMRIDIFEELATGAGRLDLYIKLIGGLSIIVELKMCGFRYSSPYAAAGEEQIIHYMDNRLTNLGYLVVLDGRLEINGQSLIPATTGPHTIIEQFVDVRPRVTRGRKVRESPAH